jgi:hypothetical protein
MDFEEYMTQAEKQNPEAYKRAFAHIFQQIDEDIYQSGVAAWKTTCHQLRMLRLARNKRRRTRKSIKKQQK